MKSRYCIFTQIPCTGPHGITTLNLLLLLLQIADAQQPSDSSSSDGYTLDNSNVSPSMAVIVVVLVIAFFIVGSISIYIQQCVNTSASAGAPAAVTGDGRSRRGAIRGLDQSAIDTFPTFLYSAVKESKIGKGSLECAVCLSEFNNEDSLRLLPKCNHVFHRDCIDAWLVGHVTCPVCRANLVPGLAQLGETVEIEPESEIPSCEVQIDIAEVSANRKLPRSHSTGHSLSRPGEDSERFTLRLPDEVRRKLVDRTKLKRATSLVVLPRVSSSRRGYHNGGEGSGSSRYSRWPFNNVVAPFIRRVDSSRPRATSKVGSSGLTEM